VAFLSPVLPVKSVPEEDRKAFMAIERTVAEWCNVFATAGCKEARDTGKKLLHPGRAAALSKTPIKLTFEEARSNPEMIKLESLAMDRPTDPFLLALMTDVSGLGGAIFDVSSDMSVTARNQSAAIERVAGRVNFVQVELGDRGSSRVPTLWSGVGEAYEMAQLAWDSMSQEARKIGDENARLTRTVNSLEDELRSSLATMTRLADRVKRAEGWAAETDKRLKILVNLQQPTVNLGSPMSESSTLGEEEVRALKERVRAHRVSGRAWGLLRRQLPLHLGEGRAAHQAHQPSGDFGDGDQVGGGVGGPSRLEGSCGRQGVRGLGGIGG
jgi:hypothetical protein